MQYGICNQYPENHWNQHIYKDILNLMLILINMNWLYLNKPQWCLLHIVIATPSLVGYIFLSVSFGKSKDICRSIFAICSYKLFMGVQKNFNLILWYLHLQSAQRSSVPHIVFAVQLLCCFKISFEISLNIFEGYIQIIGTFASKHYSISTHTKQLKCQTETYLGGTFPSGILTHGVCPLGGE